LNNIIPSFRIGMTAPEVVAEIVKVNPEIRAVSFHPYTPRKNVKENSLPLSFSRLLYHDSSKERIIKLTREEIAAVIKLKREGKEPQEGYFLWADEVVGVMSRIRVRNKILHIPLMDFCCEDSPDNLKQIKGFLYEVGQKRGVILLSGRSYHYYGVDLLSDKEWVKFLGKCLLFSGYTDERYIGHRLLDGCGILRISARGIRSQMPTVVSILE